MGIRFTATDSFFSEELGSEYVAGMSYEAQEEGEEHAKLRALIPQWIAEGKVREGGPQSEVMGEGTAETPDKAE